MNKIRRQKACRETRCGFTCIDTKKICRLGGSLEVKAKTKKLRLALTKKIAKTPKTKVEKLRGLTIKMGENLSKKFELKTAVKEFNNFLKQNPNANTSLIEKQPFAEQVIKMRTLLLSGSVGKLNIASPTEVAKTRASTVLQFKKFTSATVTTPIKLTHEDTRPYTAKRNGVHEVVIRSGSKDNIVWHELGHIIEKENPWIKAINRDWVYSRSKTKKLEPLGGGYGADELAVKGKFFHPYVGKLASNGSTEVFSMGMERMTDIKSMLKFYSDAPEHFNLIVGTVLQLKRKAG
ncbi:MAG: hypothetical protein ACRDBG_25990 [Waterburya sp.]